VVAALLHSFFENYIAVEFLFLLNIISKMNAVVLLAVTNLFMVHDSYFSPETIILAKSTVFQAQSVKFYITCVFTDNNFGIFSLLWPKAMSELACLHVPGTKVHSISKTVYNTREERDFRYSNAIADTVF